MSPLRIGQQIPWETAFTFEDVMNHVTSVAEEHELFFFEAGETPSDLSELYDLAQRFIRTLWTGKRTTTADTKALEKIISSCKVGQDREGKPYVYTLDIEALSEKGLDFIDELGGTDGLRRGLVDGFCELLLRGDERDVRACLWDGRLFRADRTNAVFCRPSCRTAFHRARNTAVHSNRSDDELMGKFCCADCKSYHLIDEASGVIRHENWISIGGLRKADAICAQCVEKNHPEWVDYVVPMGATE